MVFPYAQEGEIDFDGEGDVVFLQERFISSSTLPARLLLERNSLPVTLTDTIDLSIGKINSTREVQTAGIERGALARDSWMRGCCWLAT